MEPKITHHGKPLRCSKNRIRRTQEKKIASLKHYDGDQVIDGQTIRKHLQISVRYLALPVTLIWMLLSTTSTVLAFDWPQFRGPDGQGHAPGRGLPLRWNQKTNIVWKVPVPGKGWSSPVIQGQQIWLTTAVGKTLRVLCLDRETGRLQQNVVVFRKESLGRIHFENSHATPTLVLERNRVYAHFGSHGTACLSTNGKILWTTVLKYYHHHGPASSPIVVDDVLIVACDGFIVPFYDKNARQRIDDFQFIAALDKSTGQIRWKKKRTDGSHSYATPLAIDMNATTQVISPGANRVTAYDPTNGEELWWCRFKGYSIVPRPVFGHGLVFVCTGYESPASLLAIRPNGRGDVTETHVAWELKKQVPLCPSPLLVNDQLYLLNEKGFVSCVDARTGKVHWKERVGRKYYASPLSADDRIYFLSTTGTTQVVSPGMMFQRLATNRLAGERKVFASIAVSGRSFFIRTERNLYRIEERNAD